MAFGKINETHEATGSFKRYFGVAPVRIIAVNPTLAQLTQLGFKLNDEPIYKSKTDEGVDQFRVEFIVETVAEKCNNINAIFRIPFTLRKQAVVGSNTGKYKVMDIYGQTAWATKEEVNNKSIPMYGTGPANITKDYHVLCDGEENLTNFIRTYLGIPNVTKFVNGRPAGMIDNPADAQGVLDHIKDYFNGDISEINDIIKLAPNNWIKCLVGIKTTTENKQYQNVFTHFFVSGGSDNYNRLSKILQENLSFGRYATTYFGPTVGDSIMLQPLTEYTVDPTEIQPTNAPIPSIGAQPINESTDLPF